MAQISNIDAANNKGVLWPPIADTLDTFLRRRHSDAGPYEKVWRLIHVWESIAITLSTTSMARVQQSTGTDLVELWRRQRELFYGKTWDQVTASFKSTKGAADGGIDQWISILDEVSKSDHFESRFLSSLKVFLNTEIIEMGPFLIAWAKACDVPSDFNKQGKVKVTHAMRYVNSFRNRFAHVPFPYDPLAEVYEALETATDQLFSIPPLPSSHEKNGQSNPLTGAIFYKRCYFHGNHLDSLYEETSGKIQFRFPCQQKQTEGTETWSAQVFVHIDAMMRPHLLTRIKNSYLCEYTRFRAEANAVLTLKDDNLINVLPILVKAEYQIEEELIESEPPLTRPLTLVDATEAIRSEEFETAIEICEQLIKEQPNYHSAWLRLGYARRERAVRLSDDQINEAIDLLQNAINDLNHAVLHKSKESQALAHYELSKVYYHLNRLDKKISDAILLSFQEATISCQLSVETKYQSWLNYLEELNPKLPDMKITENNLTVAEIS